MNSETTTWEIPAHQSYFLKSRKSQYAIVIPVINEGERIRTQLREMTAMAATHDILIADGASTDGSMNIDFLKECHVRALFIKTGPGTYGAQLRVGLAHAMREGYEGIVLIDGNNKDNWEAVPDFMEALKDGFDHIQGSRFVPGGQAIKTPLKRLLGIRLVHAPLISLASGFHYTDTTNGYRAYSRRLLLDPRVQPFRNVLSSYEIHYYLAIRSARLGFRVKEIPVTRRYPLDGHVPTKISSWGSYMHMLKILAQCSLGAFDPPS